MRFSPSALLVSLTALAPCLIEASSLTPPVLPLVVRSPYLNTWLADAREPPWTKWPIFWTGQEVGMSIMASVPDSYTNSYIVYPLLGRPQDSLSSNSSNVSFPVYLGPQYDASTTNLTYQIPAPKNGGAPVNLTISFLSPITPTSTLRQSIPASYINVIAEGDFDIDIYMDVNGLWVTGDADVDITSSAMEPADMRPYGVGAKDSLRAWVIKRNEELLFTEIEDRAEWGRLVFTGPGDASWKRGSAKDTRTDFAMTGTLPSYLGETDRSGYDTDAVYALRKALKLSQYNGTADYSDLPDDVNPPTNSVLFTLAHIQDDVVQFASARGLTNMRPLWKSYIGTDEALVKFHYEDFRNATFLAKAYADQLDADALQLHSSDYRDILALSARQVLGAVQFSGTPDSPLIFQKEISSNGNTQTVDVIFPAFPFYLYTQPRWAAYLLEPLLEHQLSGQYPNNYSMHDLGAHFPNLTGHADGKDEYMPVEECGDMLIMGLALVNSLLYGDGKASTPKFLLNSENERFLQNDNTSVYALRIDFDWENSIFYLDNAARLGWASNSLGKKWLSTSYRLFKQWTEYLVDFSLEPHNQLSTDDFAGWLALQTNLALKGIVGIKAMSELSRVMGEDVDVAYYKNISDTYAARWQTLGMTRDGSHAKLAYDWYGSWTTLYSLYPASLLCFQTPAANAPANFTPFLPPQLFVNQSLHYANVMQKYGLPLDSRHRYTKSDWAFSAAAVASPEVRESIIYATAKWLNETTTNKPFSDLYDTEGTGGFAQGTEFKARPVVGSHFAVLALEKACGGGGRAIPNYFSATGN